MERNCLLIGNGLNRINNEEVEWGKVLRRVVDTINTNILINYPDFIEIDMNNLKGTSYSFQFEYIANYVNSYFGEHTKCDCKKAYKNIKGKFVNEINSNLAPLNSKLCDKINEINVRYLLTTNYDVNLERSLCNLDSYTVPYEISNKNVDCKYLFNRTNRSNWAIKDKDIYHIHGIETNTSSICLGFEHYAGMVNQLRDKLSGMDYLSEEYKGKKEPNIIGYLKDKNKKNYAYSAEFETRFFENDISILGINLNENEIDLWWLLVFRAYLYFSNICDAKKYITNTIKYYEIVERKGGYNEYINNRKEIFDKLHVQYISKEIDTWKMSSEQKVDLYCELLEEIKTDYNSKN